MQVGERHHRHHVVYPPTHLSVLEDEQPRVVLGPGRKADMVHSIPILTHSKVEPYNEEETAFIGDLCRGWK